MNDHFLNWNRLTCIATSTLNFRSKLDFSVSPIGLQKGKQRKQCDFNDEIPVWFPKRRKIDGVVVLMKCSHICFLKESSLQEFLVQFRWNRLIWNQHVSMKQNEAKKNIEHARSGFWAPKTSETSMCLVSKSFTARTLKNKSILACYLYCNFKFLLFPAKL